MSKFEVWDYVVLVAVLFVSGCIGIYYRLSGGKQKTTKEYLMADQSMSAIPVSFSLMASFMSAITLMGVSNESYQFGISFCLINLAYVISTPLIAYLYLPVFYSMRVTSVYEYLERRFGNTMRLFASFAYSIQMILYMSIVLYAPALALEALTGINKFTAILAIGTVCTFYSTIGGMKAVLITDVFQSLLMFAAIYSVIIVSVVQAGGWQPIWSVAKDNGRLNAFEFSLDPTVRHTFWNLLLGGMITYMSLYGVNQTQVQRLLSVRNLKGSQTALWLNLPILGVLSCSTLFSGLAIFYYYRECDPVTEGRIKSRDQLMPIFAMDTMSQYPGLCGLFVSGIFSASLSTVSSAVSSLAAVTLEDYIKPLYKKVLKQSMTDSNTAICSKIVACAYGLLCITLAFGASSLVGVLQASLTIFGVVGGPLLAVFTLGMFTVRANQRGVLIGLTVSLIFSFVIGFGGPKPPPTALPIPSNQCQQLQINTTLVSKVLKNMNYQGSFAANSTKVPIQEPKMVVDQTNYFWLYRISYLWYSVIGFLITMLLGYIASWLLEHLGWADNKQIYIDPSKKILDYDVFAPPFARRLRMNAAVDEALQCLNLTHNTI